MPGAQQTLVQVPASEIPRQGVVDVIVDAYRRYEILLAPRISLDGLADEIQPDSEFFLVREGDALVACAMICRADGFFAASGDLPTTKPDWLEGAAPPEYEEPPHVVAFDGDLADALYFGLAAVRRDAQSSGLGRQLVRRAETIARERGAARVVLTTLREFGLPAYYERLGYRLVGTESYPAGHWSISVPHTFCYMEKVLVPEFREATRDDLPALTRLINLAYRVEDFFKHADRTDEAEIEQLLGRGAFLVAEGEGGVPVGTVWVATRHERGYFGLLAVDPARQGAGIGRRLIAAAEERARTLGHTEMDLSVASPRVELPAFYRRLGYREVGTEPWPEDAQHELKRPAHFIVMRKSLTSGDRP